MYKAVQVVRRFTPEKWGGTEAVVVQLARDLARHGIQSPIHATSMLSVPGRDTMESVPIHRHRSVLPWFGLSADQKQQMRLKGGNPLSLPLFFALLREKKVSIYHTHVQHRLGGMVRTAARLKGVPYVVTLHGGWFTLPMDQIERMKAPFSGKFEWGRLFGALFGSRRVLADAHGIICVGEDEYLEVRRRFPEKPVFHVPNGVDVARFSSVEGERFRQAYGFGASEKIILCVSRIDYQKNQLGLLRAFGGFSRSHPDHRLVLIGPVTVEHYREEIRVEIERLGLESLVTVIEGLHPEDPLLPSAYRAAEIFVLPSLHEPFGIVILEAWAAGVPVIASRVGGVTGFAEDRENALLVEPQREEELVGALSELADSVPLRIDLARRAFSKVAAHYDWSATTGRIREIYTQLIGRNEG